MARRGMAELPPTPRQREILAYVAAGWRNAAIAAHLGISELTVRAALSDCYRRLGVTRGDAHQTGGPRTLAAIWWERTRIKERGQHERERLAARD